MFPFGNMDIHKKIKRSGNCNLGKYMSFSFYLNVFKPYLLIHFYSDEYLDDL